MPAKRHALAERREIVGHSQETLSRLVGVEPTTVGRWERGETSPQPWVRPKLAAALTVSVEVLDAMLAEGQAAYAGRSTGGGPSQTAELAGDPERDPVLAPPWNYRGTVESAVVLSGGERVKRQEFVFLTGVALTAPAHQWLVHEPGPLESGLSRRRVSAALADRLLAMIPELRAMDDVAGGGTVLSLAQHEFGVVAELLDRASYDEATGRKLHGALAELGRLAGWGAYESGQPGLAQRYYVAALRAAHTVNDRLLGAHILGFMAYQARGAGTGIGDGITRPRSRSFCHRDRRNRVALSPFQMGSCRIGPQAQFTRPRPSRPGSPAVPRPTRPGVLADAALALRPGRTSSCLKSASRATPLVDVVDTAA